MDKTKITTYWFISYSFDGKNVNGTGDLLVTVDNIIFNFDLIKNQIMNTFDKNSKPNNIALVNFIELTKLQFEHFNKIE